MEIARVVALRGTCDRKLVGAVIAREGRIISVGYNGAPPGLPHCDENNHGWGHQDWAGEHLEDMGCKNATHAEANALAFAARYGVSTVGATLYVTVSPCDVCSRLIIAAGIAGVVYLEAYRDTSGLELLSQVKVGFWQFNKDGIYES